MLKIDQDLIQATSVLLSAHDTSMWNKCAYHVMVMPDASNNDEKSRHVPCLAELII